MNTWIACVLSEHAKLRRTLARGLSVTAPLCALLLSLFVLGDVELLAVDRGVPPWRAYLDSLLRIWASVLLPIMATLQAVLLAQLEHGNRQWKYLLTLPVPRATLYLGKTLNLFVLVALAHALLLPMAMASCVVTGLAEGNIGGMTMFLVQQLAASCAAAWMLAAVQLLIAIMIESFVAAISIGLLATLVALLGASAMGSISGYYPWSMPLHALKHPGAAWWIGVLFATACIGWLGMVVLQRMQVR